MALYLNISQPMGGALGWEDGKRLDELDGIFSELLRQLNFLLGNLGAENVIEAASVKAENIDTTNAKIVNAQIKNLSADKIKAGTLDLSKGITITSGGGDAMTITQDSIEIAVDGVTRFLVTPDDNGKFGFLLCNAQGQPTIRLTDDGNAVLSGIVASSEIYASHIAGVDKDTYDTLIIPDEGEYNGIFVDIGHKGMKIFQEKENGAVGQKLGTTVDSEGTVFLILGEGNGDNQYTFNGVKYSDDTLMISKGRNTTDIVLLGMNSGIQMFQDNLALNAAHVTVNSYEVATKQYVDQQIEDLKEWVQQNFQPVGV